MLLLFKIGVVLRHARLKWPTIKYIGVIFQVYACQGIKTKLFFYMKRVTFISWGWDILHDFTANIATSSYRIDHTMNKNMNT